MQVQLIVTNEHHKGRVIPVNTSSFVIGRAEGCNLRSRSARVSRYHCTILTEGETVTVQDLGSGNGTFINGHRITTIQPLKEGDELAIGSHLFLVSIQAGAESSTSNQNQFFELTPSSIPVWSTSDQDATQMMGSSKTPESVQSKMTNSVSEVMFEIRLEGKRVSVSKTRLFELARTGSVHPDDLIVVAGTKVFADSIQGIVFGDKPQPEASPGVHNATAPEPEDPFQGLVDFSSADIPSGIHTSAGEQVVRIARKESAFSALWKALDISFSRVYKVEGNDLVIHSVKALYYVVVVLCFLGIFWQMFFFVKGWYESGNLLESLAGEAVGLSVVLFGCVLIIVVVRILLEMLLLAWVESSKPDMRDKKDE